MVSMPRKITSNTRPAASSGSHSAVSRSFKVNPPSPALRAEYESDLEEIRQGVRQASAASLEQLVNY